MDRLLYDQDWSDTFPHLRQGMQCLVSGAAKADLWRALVLYEYGGIYTDLDSAPNPLAFNETTIDYEHDEAFFVVESLGITSQYFMAARPHHPLMFLLVQMTLHRLYDVSDVNTQYVPFVTGPGALKNAFIHYMGQQHGDKNGQTPYQTYQRVGAGTYHGVVDAGQSSVRVVGDKGHSNDYILREALPGKHNIYRVRVLCMCCVLCVLLWLLLFVSRYSCCCFSRVSFLLFSPKKPHTHSK
jgi:Glycosyltransferase sugar-binding region containing DXD motif